LFFSKTPDPIDPRMTPEKKIKATFAGKMPVVNLELLR
jgi:hypothetical protein